MSFATVQDNASVETVSGGRERIESPRPLGIPRPTLRSSCLRDLGEHFVRDAMPQ
jgi:hypothetical protein